MERVGEMLEMGTILLIRSNDTKAVYGSVSSNAACEPPFWAACIAAYCRKKGAPVRILDAEALDMSPQSVVSWVKKENPTLAIFTVTGTNLSASTWKMHGAMLCAAELKKQIDVPIMMWGLHPSSLPEETLADENVDFVMKGEGLSSIVDLAFSIHEPENYAKIDGLYYKKDGEIYGNSRPNLIKPEDFEEPAWDLLPMERYRAHNWQRFGERDDGEGYAVIATSLGCPFCCSFCAVSSLFGERHVRYFSPQTVIEQIDHLVEKYHVKFIKLLDENFVLNLKHVEEICDLLIARGYDLNIWAYARVDTVNEKILGKLRKAGIKWLAYGIESASELSLADMSKGQYGVQEIESVMKMTKKADINIMANFIFGLPEDTKESMQMTLDFAKKINPEFINFYCAMAYPGSALYGECVRNGVKLPDTWLGYSQFSYECEPLPTKTVSAKEVLAFRDFAFMDFFQDNDAYFQNIRERFGENAVKDIHKMLEKKMRRKLLEEEVV